MRRVDLALALPLVSGCAICAASAIGAGCAEPSPGARARVATGLERAPEGTAQVCLIRDDELAGEVTMSVRDNDRLVGATRGTTFVCWLALPGAHQIRADADDTGPTLLEARAGERYWIHQEISDLAGQAHAHLDFVDEDRAVELLDACGARVMVAAPGHDDEPAVVPVVAARPR
jgi:hypothetical protein